MLGAFAYALRRISARVVLAVGAFGLLWTALVAQPLSNLHAEMLVHPDFADPIFAPPGPYQVIGAGLSSWEVGGAVLVAGVAVVAAVALWRDRWARR